MSSNNSTQSTEEQKESASEINPVLEQFMRDPKNRYLKIAVDIAGMVYEKQLAYGDAFGKSEEVLKIFYPDGVSPDKYKDFLAFTRVVDKLFRIANRKEAFGEDPWKDITGYGILSIDNRSFKDGK